MIVEVFGYVAISYLLYRFFKLAFLLIHADPVKVKELGEWALVTGSTDGIGRAYAFALAKRGLNIVLVSRSASKLKDVAHELEEACKVKVKFIEVDFAGDSSTYIPRLEEEIRGLQIGVLVNNVGMSVEYPMPFLDMEGGDKLVKSLVDVNITSTNVMTRLVLPQMVERGRGAVVNTGSIMGHIPSPMYSVYAGVKAYVVKFSESLDLEYGRAGITVQCVSPGYVVSKMSKMRKPSLFVPTPEAFVQSALGRLGVYTFTYGYWSHDLMEAMVSIMPKGMANRMIYKQVAGIRKMALKKIAARDKGQ